VNSEDTKREGGSGRSKEMRGFSTSAISPYPLYSSILSYENCVEKNNNLRV